MNKRERIYVLMSYMLSYTWRVGEYWKAVGPSLSVWTQSHVMSSLEVAWSVVDSIYKFSDYSSVQHAPCCRLHHLQTEGKTKMEKKKKMIRGGGPQWGIHLVKLGQGARNVWVKTTTFQGKVVTVDVVFVALSVCCLVLLSASLFTVQFLNRWRPVSWWSWEEVEEGSC